MEATYNGQPAVTVSKETGISKINMSNLEMGAKVVNLVPCRWRGYSDQQLLPT